MVDLSNTTVQSDYHISRKLKCDGPVGLTLFNFLSTLISFGWLDQS